MAKNGYGVVGAGCKGAAAGQGDERVLQRGPDEGQLVHDQTGPEGLLADGRRIEVDEETPVLQGTTAQIKGVGFTGVSEIQLQGAVRGARRIPGLITDPAPARG